MSAPRHRQAGLTLVEVLVAFALFALLAMMSLQALQAMARVRETARLHAERTLGLEAGLEQWRADLDAQQESGLQNVVDFNGQVLRITRRAPADGTSLVLAAWAVKAGADGVQSWQRWMSGPLATRGELRRAWQDAGRWAQSAGVGAAGVAVAAAVAPAAGWQLLYFRDNAWSNPQSSAHPAAASLPGDAVLQEPPEGVRLTLQLPPGAGGALSGSIVRDWVRPSLDMLR